MVQYAQLWFTCDYLRTAVWTSCRHWFWSEQTKKIKHEDANDGEDGHKRLVVRLDDLTWQLELALALEQEEVDLRNLGSAHLLSYEGLITNDHDVHDPEHDNAKKEKEKSPCIKR